MRKRWCDGHLCSLFICYNKAFSEEQIDHLHFNSNIAEGGYCQLSWTYLCKHRIIFRVRISFVTAVATPTTVCWDKTWCKPNNLRRKILRKVEKNLKIFLSFLQAWCETTFVCLELYLQTLQRQVVVCGRVTVNNAIKFDKTFAFVFGRRSN